MPSATHAISVAVLVVMAITVVACRRDNPASPLPDFSNPVLRPISP